MNAPGLRYRLSELRILITMLFGCTVLFPRHVIVTPCATALLSAFVPNPSRILPMIPSRIQRSQDSFPALFSRFSGRTERRLLRLQSHLQPEEEIRLEYSIPSPANHRPRCSVGNVVSPEDSLTDHSIEDPDSFRRRRLVLTMLASISGASRMGPKTQSAWAATGLVDDSISATSAALLGDVIVPPLDDREYKAFTLPNGLRVLLCSDDSSNEIAAAVDVHVGATSDPASVPGLAHFNEQ
jgi:hypothetical protein